MIEIPLSDEQFLAAQRVLAAEGVDLSGVTGAISRQGVTAIWTRTERTLQIEITQHPMFLPKSMIESKLRDWITARLQTPGPA